MRPVWKTTGGLALGGLAVLAWWWQVTKVDRLIPVALAGAIPSETRQLVLVLAQGIDAVPAGVILLARDHAGKRWRIQAGPFPANLGRNGVGWGRDGSGLPNPGSYPDKKEGDGRSPAGVFRLPYAFGTEPQAPAGVKLPWLVCTPTLRGVDDAKSKYYNQMVDEASIPDKDWESAEIMRRDDGAYETGLLIDHNADRIAGGGSCIFLHLWKGPGHGTAGCTALAREDVRKILSWLDPAAEPRLVLGVAP